MRMKAAAIVVLMIILLAPLALATTAAADLVQVIMELSFTVAGLADPVVLSALDTWDNTTGSPAARLVWSVTGDPRPYQLQPRVLTDHYFFTLETIDSSPIEGRNAFSVGLPGTAETFPVLTPGNYDIGGTYHLEHHPSFPPGLPNIDIFSDSGSARIVAVAPEPATLLMMITTIVVGAMLFRRSRFIS